MEKKPTKNQYAIRLLPLAHNFVVAICCEVNGTRGVPLRRDDDEIELAGVLRKLLLAVLILLLFGGLLVVVDVIETEWDNNNGVVLLLRLLSPDDDDDDRDGER
jgi:hypothetical protein